jgi:hypothetical protein
MRSLWPVLISPRLRIIIGVIEIIVMKTMDAVIRRHMVERDRQVTSL